MAGRGAAPKDPDQLSRPSQTKAEVKKLRVVESEVCEPPELPEHPPVRNPMFGKRDNDGDLIDPRAEPWLEWPEHTIYWWESWINDPLTEDYRQSDWLDLLDCAVIHARLWSGDDRAASELRLRMARHGATREDRARLRIVYATADMTEKRNVGYTPPTNHNSKNRRGGISAVPNNTSPRETS